MTEQEWRRAEALAKQVEIADFCTAVALLIGFVCIGLIIGVAL